MSELAAIVSDAERAPAERWPVGPVDALAAMRFAAASHDDEALDRLRRGEREVPELYLSSVLDWALGTPTAQMRPDGLSEREAPFVGRRTVRVVHGGQRLTWRRPVVVGDRNLAATREVTRAVHRQGRSGELAVLDFVTVVHDADGAEVMSWAETILALPTIAPETPATPRDLTPFAPDGAAGVDVAFAPTDMLRFSAVTANTHRIHVDTAFAAGEGFTGPVVQSSLHGINVLRAARAARRAGAGGDGDGPGVVAELAWRNLAPACAGEPLGARARAGDGGEWIVDEWIVGGPRTATGTVRFAL